MSSFPETFIDPNLRNECRGNWKVLAVVNCEYNAEERLFFVSCAIPRLKTYEKYGVL